MCRYRLTPTPEQESALLGHCKHARYVWNLCVEQEASDARKLNRHWAKVKVPKAGWVRFRLSRPVPDGVRSFRVTRDRAGRWHVAFAHVPGTIPAPGTGEVV